MTPTQLAAAIASLKPGVPEELTVHQLALYQNGFRAAIEQVLAIVEGGHAALRAAPASQHQSN